jgi:hypothetical protein
MNLSLVTLFGGILGGALVALITVFFGVCGIGGRSGLSWRLL